jgi:hypothetical protein
MSFYGPNNLHETLCPGELSVWLVSLSYQWVRYRLTGVASEIPLTAGLPIRPIGSTTGPADLISYHLQAEPHSTMKASHASHACHIVA